MAEKISIDGDDNNEYNAITDSDGDYSEEENELLKNIRNSRKEDHVRQEEFMPFSESDTDGDDDGEDDDDESNDITMSDSDIAESEKDEDEATDTKYWGKKSSNYYHSDVLDDEYGSVNYKDNEKAELEEEEAKALQLRLLKDLRETDFQLDFQNFIQPAEEDKPSKHLLKLKSNFSGLTKRERLQLFEKDSPEFGGFMGDFEGYMEEITTLHIPVLEYLKKQKMPLILPALQFAQLYRTICLTYCNNLLFYLMLKAKRVPMKHHPVIKPIRLLKRLLNHLKNRHDKIVKPQLAALLKRINKKMQIKFVKSPFGNKRPMHMDSGKGKALANDKKTMDTDNSDSNDEHEDNDDLQSSTDGRRKITYEMEKNKGLMPSRKKQQRNPRVKHRNKYRKALIRRKGTVRPVRRELTKYGGEISGIKTTVSKSVKFNS